MSLVKSANPHNLSSFLNIAVSTFEVEAVSYNTAKVQSALAIYCWKVDVLALALAYEAAGCLWRSSRRHNEAQLTDD